jgi:hypothetical protein
MYLT